MDFACDCCFRQVIQSGAPMSFAEVPLGEPSVQSAPINTRVMQTFNQLYRPQYLVGIEEHIGRMNPFCHQWTGYACGEAEPRC